MLRNTSFLLASALFIAAAHAQQTTSDPLGHTMLNQYGQEVTVTTASDFHLTPPMSEWPVISEDGEHGAAEKFEVENDRKHHELKPVLPPPMMDPALQTAPATHVTRAPLVGWTAQAGTGYPPDPTGAAGPDRYVQAVNTAYRVYQKTGTPATAAHNLSTLWAGSQSEGDPVVLYDRHADRWFISQFNSNPSRMLIALSQTGDPAGAYYTWSFTLSQFPDYPKFSVWWDGYYMTSNSSKTAIVFERPAMLTGSPTARMVALSAPGIQTTGFTSVLPADADGDIPPAGTPCYFFNMEDDSWSGVPNDRIKVFEMTTDWNNTGNTHVLLTRTLATEAFDSVFPWSWDDIEQPGTTQKLDAIADVFTFRAQYMRWSGYNTVVLCNVVDVDGNDHAGIRWYELRDADDGQWTIHQQGTWAPDEAHRFIGSIAMDNTGNIGLAYSYSNPTMPGYPGLRYTGRFANDPLGQMTVAEQVGVVGMASQEGTNRYGDYSQMSLDPDGTAFWYTGEYIGSGGNIRTRIFSFRLDGTSGMAPVDPYYANAVLHVTNDHGVLDVRIEGLHTDEALTFDIIGMDGRTLRHANAEPSGGRWSTRADVRALAAASYFVRVGNAHFQKVERLVITDNR